MANEPKKPASDHTPSAEKRKRAEEVLQDKIEKEQKQVFTFSDWASI